MGGKLNVMKTSLNSSGLCSSIANVFFFKMETRHAKSPGLASKGISLFCHVGTYSSDWTITFFVVCFAVWWVPQSWFRSGLFLVIRLWLPCMACSCRNWARICHSEAANLNMESVFRFFHDSRKSVSIPLPSIRPGYRMTVCCYRSWCKRLGPMVVTTLV